MAGSRCCWLCLQTSAPERVGTIIFYTGTPGTPSSLAFPAQLGNLADVRRLSCGMFPRRLAKSISQGIACGLSHMHYHSIIHRDLKPQNVLIGTDDVGVLIPRIADFGWARSMRDAAGGASQPPSGEHDADQLEADTQMQVPHKRLLTPMVALQVWVWGRAVGIG